MALPKLATRDRDDPPSFGRAIQKKEELSATNHLLRRNYTAYSTAVMLLPVGCFRIHFGKCAQELRNLVPPFYHRTASCRERWHHYAIDIQPTRTKRFSSTFLIRNKSRVNRHLLGKRAPS
ncbi:jg16529 [Pararge aegeria aegeria]|uniref:Jg16529 protein n=1 Tax=Pararge aegeria aegeria TaxID=348720 RepID=A0A8S4SKB9_9NEOP|nr:jg16529 [Pararge aegeria aegeria]